MVSSYISVKKAVDGCWDVDADSGCVMHTTLVVGAASGASTRPDHSGIEMFSILGAMNGVTHEVRLGSPMATPELDEAIEINVETAENLPWMCIVWDDPVNLQSYVTYVFQTVLGYSRKRAQELMMQVHTEGKAVVSSGEKDKVEGDVKKLHTAGLWATMQQAG